MSTTKTLSVFFGTEKRRIQLNRDFDSFKATISERFEVQGRVILKATIHNDTGGPYTVNSQDDLNDIWEEIETVEITTRAENPGLQLMKASESSVGACAQEYRSDNDMGTNDIVEVNEGFKSLGTFAKLTYLASVATGDIEMQTKMSAFVFSLLAICQQARLAMSVYSMCSTKVVEDLQIALLHFQDDNIKGAMRTLSTLGTSATECVDSTNNLIKAIGRLLPSEDDKNQNYGAKKVLSEKGKFDILCKGAQLNHSCEETKGAVAMKAVEIEQLPRGILSSVRSLAVVEDLNIPSDLVDTLELGISALIRGTTYTEELERKQRTERERTELVIQLDRLQHQVKELEDAQPFFHMLTGQLKFVAEHLLSMSTFFQMLLMFCTKIEEKCVSTLDKEKLHHKGFQKDFIGYHARWVAIGEVGKECRRCLQETIREMNNDMDTNTTKEEARRLLPIRIEETRRAIRDGL